MAKKATIGRLSARIALAGAIAVGALGLGKTVEAQSADDTLTISWPTVYSFIGVPSRNGGRQGERLVWMGVHETALRINANGEIVPHLAESWEVSEDGLVHTVKLRQGVQFHGGWGEMTAEDWAWTAQDQWQGKPASNHGGQFIANTNLEEVKVVDDYTIEFILKRPNAFFREYYGSIRDDVGLAAYSKKRVDEMGFEEAITRLPDGGTGPYQIESWVADTEIVLKAFPEYWGDQPDYPTIRIVEISEPSTVLAALETGDIDAAKVPVTARARVETAGLEVRSAGVGHARIIFAGNFCFKEFDGEPVPARPGYDPSLPWVGNCDDPASIENARKVRKAMSMAVDRQALVDVIAGGHGRPSYVHMLQGFFADRYMKDEWVIAYDPEQAKTMLADAGYPDGFEFELVCTTSGHPLLTEFCEATAGMWSSIGLQPQIRRIAPDAFRKQLVAREFNGIRLRVDTGVTPIPEARGFGETPTGAFNSGYEVPGLIDLVRQASVAVTDEERDAIRERQYQWAFDQHLEVPLAEFDEIYAVNPDKIGAWNRTPFNAHSSTLMDFESIKKPE